jgi:predicted transcriptional regulator
VVNVHPSPNKETQEAPQNTDWVAILPSTAYGNTAMPRLKTMTIKLPPSLSAKVARLARKRGASQSEIVREALEAYAGHERPSFSESAAAFRGVANGPGALSTNPAYLEEFGK